MLDGIISARRRGPFEVGRSLLPDGQAAGLRIAGLGPEARFKMRVREDEVAQLAPIAGVTIDMPINSFTSSGSRSIARLGPSEWLLLTTEADGAALARDAAAALGSTFHALIDISHRHAALIVSGAEAANVLNSGCPLDLSARRFPTGTATRTLLGKAEIILMRTSDAPDFRLEFGRSFAGYIQGFLAENAG